MQEPLGIMSPEAPPAVGRPFLSGRAKSIPARFHSAAATQISAGAPADAAESIPANFVFRCQMRSNPNPAGAARWEFFWARGQILFRVLAISPAAIQASRLFAV